MAKASDAPARQCISALKGVRCKRQALLKSLFCFCHRGHEAVNGV